MFSHIVVIRDKHGGHADCSGKAFESGSWSGVDLVGPVESFNELFERTILRTCLIHVLESYNGFP